MTEKELLDTELWAGSILKPGSTRHANMQEVFTLARDGLKYRAKLAEREKILAYCREKNIPVATVGMGDRDIQ